MAILRFAEFEGFEQFRNWAYKRANWLALDELTRRQRFVSNPEQVIASATEQAEPSKLDWLLPLLEILPKQQKTVALDLLRGYTTKEVALRHDIKPATVRSLWRHAKQRLVSEIE